MGATQRAPPTRPCPSLPTTPVVIQFGRVRGAQWAHNTGGRDASGEAVAGEQIQVAVLERDGRAWSSSRISRPSVQSWATAASMYFVALGTWPARRAGPPSRRGTPGGWCRTCRGTPPSPSCGGTPARWAAGHLAAVGVVHRVDHAQQVLGLRDPPVLRERRPERGRAALAAEHPQQLDRLRLVPRRDRGTRRRLAGLTSARRRHGGPFTVRSRRGLSCSDSSRWMAPSSLGGTECHGWWRRRVVVCGAPGTGSDLRASTPGWGPAGGSSRRPTNCWSNAAAESRKAGAGHSFV